MLLLQYHGKKYIIELNYFAFRGQPFLIFVQLSIIKSGISQSIVISSIPEQPDKFNL
jgi:hypothetical protein